MNQPPEKIALYIPARTIVKVVAVVLAAWLLVDISRLVASALLLLMVAAFLAVALDPAVRFIQRRGLPRLWSVVVLGFVVLVILAGMVTLFSAPLVSQSSKLADRAPHFQDDLLKHESLRKINDSTHVIDKGAKGIEKLPDIIAEDAADIAEVALHGVIGALTLVFLTAFLLIEGPQLAHGAVVLWPQLRERRWWTLLEDSYSAIGKYVGGTLIVSLVDAVVIAALLLVMGVPFLLPLALWAFVWGFVPIIGGVVGTAPAVLVAFTVSPVAGIVVTVGSLLYHIIGRAILHPAIVGHAIEMSAFFVFLAILFGESVLGIVGILLAVPIAAIVQLVIADIVARREDPPPCIDPAPTAPGATPDDPPPAPA